MGLIYRVWIDVEVYDPATEGLETVEVSFGPSATFRPADESPRAAEVARLRAVQYAEQLHDARDVALILAQLAAQDAQRDAQDVTQDVAAGR